ncbi:3-deoxy-manno-octulosonate cytidylyltransferase (CMP-KDO synthetase) [Litorimonas taeanensis]|uniref:3-deoxy-manno-octulosonate cytidylyltransferase (CMP-KDO synthetase) n=1 Tax=Litorimonas taeanensis TaxID=568099 RepID=A0A420WK38_9PROT|nr:manno-octulosonate cytidylyltransferase [Litorimonas taeanensis]RKQ71370.1 3-deoxy-manno-octulosonate cytidylyltransferase (CMP-KDO synthetase) [Litorimonas taeanensis]
MKTAIIVPARYGSTRFPGKPLAKLGGISMVVRTAKNAQLAATALGDAVAMVATDDSRIMEHCKAEGLLCLMTDSDLPSGSDRALAAVTAYEAQSSMSIDTIVNLQGDAPFTPPAHVESVVNCLRTNKHFDVATPFIQLDWAALDQLRRHKETTPFSGTTLVSDDSGKALWFSKNIIPAIRKEDDLRLSATLSPVRRHIGLYAYRKSTLEKYVSLPIGHWEALEGLEQLRCLENGISIGCVGVEPAEVAISGIDTPEDLKRAEAMLMALNR